MWCTKICLPAAGVQPRSANHRTEYLNECHNVGAFSQYGNGKQVFIMLYTPLEEDEYRVSWDADAPWEE